MAIIPSPKNPLQLMRKFRDKMEERTNITNYDRDSKVRVITDTLVNELLVDREEMIDAFYANQISNATGAQLDAIGQSMGLRRRLPTFANVQDTERSLAFYVESGNFGSINGGLPITLPQGTVVRTRPNNNELGITVDYTLEKSVVLGATSTLTFASARASVIGAAQNVGAEVIRSHDFTDYTDSGAGSLKVVNFYPILNGRDRETDQSYRYRLTEFYSSLSQANSARIKLMALDTAGVLQTRVMSGYYGIGTAGVAVIGPEFQTNERMLRGVQSNLETIATPGLRVQATASVQASFDFELQIKPNRSLTTGDQAVIRATVKRAMLDYFRRLGIGNVVNFSDLARIVQEQTQGVVTFDSIGDSKLFKKITVRKGLPGSTTDERQTVIADIYLLPEDTFAALSVLSFEFL